MKKELVDILACPVCKTNLELQLTAKLIIIDCHREPT